MQIAQDTVVAFDYTLTDPAGRKVESSVGRAPMHYLHGYRQIIPGLEAELEGKSAGDEFRATVPPESAYGPHRAEMLHTLPRSSFPPKQMIMVGQQLQAKNPQGRTAMVRVAKVSETEVTIDTNHPLAGVTLTFDVKVASVRAATPEEIAHKHVHGPGGHKH